MSSTSSINCTPGNKPLPLIGSELQVLALRGPIAPNYPTCISGSAATDVLPFHRYFSCPLRLPVDMDHGTSEWCWIFWRKGQNEETRKIRVLNWCERRLYDKYEVLVTVSLNFIVWLYLRVRRNTILIVFYLVQIMCLGCTRVQERVIQ